MRPITKKAGRPAFFCGLVLLCIFLAGCIESAFYYPDRVVYSTREQRGLAFEKVRFASRDGTRLRGCFIPAPGVKTPGDAVATVVHFHGNAQNMSSHWEFVAWLPARGYNVVVSDYRDYGESEGTPSIKGVFEDSNAALDYVRTRPDVDRERLLVLGQSLGGANAIAAEGSGKRAGIKAMATDSAFYSYSAIANDKLPGAGLLLDDTYSAERFVAALAPLSLLLMHGTADQMIPYHHGKSLMLMARGPKALITVPGVTHLEALDGRRGTKFRDALLEIGRAHV